MTNYLNEKRRTEMLRYRNEAWEYHTVVSRLVLKQHGLSGQVKGRPWLAGDAYERQDSAHDARALVIICIRNYLAGSSFFCANIGTLVVLGYRRQRFEGGLIERSRRPIRRPFFIPNHKRERLAWSRRHGRFNLQSWRRIHWSDGSRVFVYMVDSLVLI